MVTHPDGIMLRKFPSQKADRTGILLHPGEIFLVSDIVTDVDEPNVDDDGLQYWKQLPADEPCFLRLADGRGWALDRHPATQELNIERFEPNATGCRRFRQCLRGLFLSPPFEYGMMLLIFVNAIFIGLEIDDPHMMKHHQWLIVNSVFALCYVIEMSLKLYVFPVREFFRSHWNVYDLVVTLTTLIGDLAVITMYFIDPHHTDSSGLSAVIPVLRLLRLLRVARLFQQLRLLMTSLIHSAAPLFWIIVFMVLWFYISACLTTIFVGRKSNLQDGDVEDAPKLRAMFKNIKTSMYTLFEVMMMEGWIEVVRPLVKHRPFLVLFFLVFVFLSAFFLLNLVTSVVVDRTLRAHDSEEAKHELVEEDLRVGRISELYNALVSLNEGRDLVQPERLHEWEPHHSVEHWLNFLGMDAPFLDSLCEMLDHTPAGEISLKALRDSCICSGLTTDTGTFMRVQIQVVRRMQQLIAHKS